MMRRIKVSQLCTVHFTLKTLLLPLVDAMSERNWDVTCIRSEGKWVESMRRDGYRIITAPMTRRVGDVLFHVRSLYYLYQLFKREKFDVLYVHSPIAGC